MYSVTFSYHYDCGFDYFLYGYYYKYYVYEQTYFRFCCFKLCFPL